MRRTTDYIDGLAGVGCYCFTTTQLQETLDISLLAARAVLRRLRSGRLIATPYRGFHAIVPPEYRGLGCLPPEQFVPQLMEHLGECYYVTLLSAAQFHGAAHQRPQSFQVMVAHSRKPLSCGQVKVEFVARSDLTRMKTGEFKTLRGPIRVASPETVALELIGYPGHGGGLDNVATVLFELGDAIDPEELALAAAACPIAWGQKLGFVLEHLGLERLLQPLAAYVRTRSPATAPLVRSLSITGTPRAERWKVAVNAGIEPDL